MSTYVGQRCAHGWPRKCNTISYIYRSLCKRALWKRPVHTFALLYAHVRTACVSYFIFPRCTCAPFRPVSHSFACVALQIDTCVICRGLAWSPVRSVAHQFTCEAWLVDMCVWHTSACVCTYRVICHMHISNASYAICTYQRVMPHMTRWYVHVTHICMCVDSKWLTRHKYVAWQDTNVWRDSFICVWLIPTCDMTHSPA